MSDYKLVFHINENDRWPFTLRSVRNFIRADGHRFVVADFSAIEARVIA